jgi:hypothetical protein
MRPHAVRLIGQWMKPMTKSWCASILLLFVVAGCGPSGLRDQTTASAPGTSEAAAKATVESLVVALSRGDKESALKCVGVPYFNHHDFGIITAESELKQRYDDVFGPWIDSGGFPRTLTGINRYREQRDSLPAGPRKWLDQVISEDDWIVMLGDGPSDERYFLVKVGDGKARVVGIMTR